MTSHIHMASNALSGTLPLRFRERANARTGVADVLVFRLGAERFAVDLQSVDETIEAPEVHEVGGTAPTILGVFRHGAQLLTLYDTASVLGMRREAAGPLSALVMRGGGRRIGLAVGDVEDVVKLDLSLLRDVPDGVWDDELLLGLFVRDGLLVALVDARSLISACQTPSIPEAL
ncbi:MAG: hypothetical protein MNPFHGCM_01635 [Gemmatimonadaceae bacterium]|nr:hypothetical protein [Gemmatimonadaceae bacterium]